MPASRLWKRLLRFEAQDTVPALNAPEHARRRVRFLRRLPAVSCMPGRERRQCISGMAIPEALGIGSGAALGIVLVLPGGCDHGRR